MFWVRFCCSKKVDFLEPVFPVLASLANFPVFDFVCFVWSSTGFGEGFPVGLGLGSIFGFVDGVIVGVILGLVLGRVEGLVVGRDVGDEVVG